MKYKVEALDTYVKNNIKDKELHKIPEEGSKFEVSESRLKELLGDNPYQMTFVKLVEDEEKNDSKKRKIKSLSN